MNTTQVDVVAQKIEELEKSILALERIKGALPETSYVQVSDKSVQIWPNDAEVGRRIVGSLIRIFKAKPEIRKWNDTNLEAKFTIGETQYCVNRYKGKKCAIITKTIVHEAVPEQIVPAKEAWVETKEELVCDLSDVEAEVTPANSDTQSSF